MLSHQTIFAGVDFSSGHRPVTFAALDVDLNIVLLERWSFTETVTCLGRYEKVVLAINLSSQRTKQRLLTEFKRKVQKAGLQFAPQDSPRRWMETDVQKWLMVLAENVLLSRRTLEGRIQRALMLYDEGLQISDPMDFFEEITRHKLMQGILPLENMYTARQLDVLLAAYIAWMTVNRPRQVHVQDGLILPSQE